MVDLRSRASTPDAMVSPLLLRLFGMLSSSPVFNVGEGTRLGGVEVFGENNQRGLNLENKNVSDGAR